MKYFLFSVILILISMSCYSQNLIGYNALEIRNYMKENLRDMSSENVANSRFKYLKYSDSSDRQTMLFFLNPDSVCKSIRLICDLTLKAQKVKEFNSNYRKTAENKWIDTRNGKDFLVEIREERWSCIVTIDPVK